MSDLPHPCEHDHACQNWTESISLAAAGCLSPDEERELRRHIETCSACREEFRQLTELCRALAEGPAATDRAEAAVVERIMSAVTADVSRRPFVRTVEEMIHPSLHSHSPGIRSWIMRSPVTRISAAVFLAIAIGGIAVWLNGGRTALAFGDLIEPILTAKTVTFTTTTYGGEGQKITGKVLATASPQRVRLELDQPDGQKLVTISNETGGITLRPTDKLAIVTTVANVPKEKRPKAIFFELRSQLAGARDQSDWIRESLGEKVIDGQRLVGYRLTGRDMIYELWGEPKTGLLVRVESSAPSDPHAKRTIYTDFVFDAKLSESLFSMDPPAGYKVQKLTADASPAQESDLVETFRRYAQLSGGTLPDQLDIAAVAKLFQENWAKSHPTNGSGPSEQERQEQLSGLLKLARGISFAFERLPREADAHYAGKGIKVGTVDTPVFWYRDAAKYRIISADLSVHEADAAPSVPNAQSLSTSGQRK